MTFTVSHDHVSITVTPEDLDATIQWYSRNLGFIVDQRFECHDTTFVYYTAGDAKIESLASASNHNGAPTSNVLTSMNPQRLHDFCVAVQDLDAAVSQLLEHDVPLIGAQWIYPTSVSASPSSATTSGPSSSSPNHAVLVPTTLAARGGSLLLAARLAAVATAAAGPVTFVALATPRTENLLSDVFGLDAKVLPDPAAGAPLVVPVSAHPRS